MNVPGGNTTGPGAICTHCHTGKIEVIVWQHAVCWDTPAEGENATDPRFEGVTVLVNESETRTNLPDGRVQIDYDFLVKDTTDDSGKVVFENLIPATYSISARKPAEGDKPPYEDVTSEIRRITVRGSQVILNHGHSIEVRYQETSYCDLVMRAKQARLTASGKWTPGRECLRRHVQPTPDGAAGDTLAKIFWSREPTLLQGLDIIWAIFLPLILVIAVVAVALGMIGPMGMLSVAAICTAFLGYIGGVIFGESYGTGNIAFAFAMMAIVLAANLLAAAFGFADPDPTGVGILGGIWAAFGVGYLPGRREEWRVTKKILFLPEPIMVSALAGAAGGAALAAMLAAVADVPVGGPIAIASILGALLGSLSGWMGWAFANEGKTQLGFGPSDFKLPFVGERYCLQGARGFWTHFEGEEDAYDWSLPYDTRVLSSKEGHIVSHFSATECNGDRSRANHVAVRHKDGSIARYVYFKEAHPPLLDETADPPRTPEERFEVDRAKLMDNVEVQEDWRFPIWMAAPSTASNPPHVRDGHVLGAAACQGRSGSEEPVESAMGVFWFGVAVAVVSLGLVFIAGFTAWKGEPPDQMYSIAPGDFFTKLFSTSDSNYSYGWPAVRYQEEADRFTEAARQAQERGDTAAVNDNKSKAAAKEAQAKAQMGTDAGPKLLKLAACKDHPAKFDEKFCECLTLGPIEQYGNTFSDFLFVILGLFFILLPFGQSGPNKLPFDNRMTNTLDYTRTYGGICIFMGPGSMLLHISMTASGGLGDGLSMYFLGGFLISYNIIRLTGWSTAAFYGILFGLVVGCLVANVIMLQKMEWAPMTTMIMIPLVGIGIVLLLIASLVYEHASDGWWWFGGALLSFACAFTVWGLSSTGGPLCQEGWVIFSPPSFVQGHALWHMFSAFGVFCIYKFLTYEKGDASCLTMPRLHFTVSEAPPPGPPLDEERWREEDDPRVEIKFKPVKFSGGGDEMYESRPWSMRKCISSNTSLGLPRLFEFEALFIPHGGEHSPATADGPERAAPAAAAPGGQPSSPVPGAPAGPPSLPEMPGGGTPPVPGGGMPGGGAPGGEIPGGGTPPGGGLPPM